MYAGEILLLVCIFLHWGRGLLQKHPSDVLPGGGAAYSVGDALQDALRAPHTAASKQNTQMSEVERTGGGGVARDKNGTGIHVAACHMSCILSPYGSSQRPMDHRDNGPRDPLTPPSPHPKALVPRPWTVGRSQPHPRHSPWTLAEDPHTPFRPSHDPLPLMDGGGGPTLRTGLCADGKKAASGGMGLSSVLKEKLWATTPTLPPSPTVDRGSYCVNRLGTPSGHSRPPPPGG